MTAWNILFCTAGAITLVTAFALIFVRHPMHGAVYLITSLLALAVDFYLLGFPFLAVLQVILYVGAIMVLYVFFIILNPSTHEAFSLQKSHLLFALPLLIIVLIETAIILSLSKASGSFPLGLRTLSPKELGIELFSNYKIAVELLSTLLLAALVAVIYLAKHLLQKEDTGK